MNFEQFTKSDKRNAWIYDHKIDMYVRRCTLPNRKADYELANLSAKYPGHGFFTEFLDEWEPIYSFYIENVINKRLERFLIRRGYQPVNDYTIRSYIK